MNDSKICVRALRSFQGEIPLYSFFLPGAMLLKVADICRLARSSEGIEGFQRGAIQKHINGIVEYLNGGDALFPNAILLALSARSVFTRSRGPSPKGLIDAGCAGVLRFPTSSPDSKVAWLVDGQQRSVALARCNDPTKPVPVVAFATDDIRLHREQFVLVNKARPLPRRLVDELLPEMDGSRLPRDIAPRQIPSLLVGRLDEDVDSPFFGLIARTTLPRSIHRVVTDSALVRGFQRQIHQPLGALAGFRSIDGVNNDAQAMFEMLVKYWNVVKETFPSAWGLPPERSRLMHSAGIESMTALMDFLAPSAAQASDPTGFLRTVLERISPSCAWTDGRWPDLGCHWNEIEGTPKDIKRLTDQLIRLAQTATLRLVA